jgi:hypothetical protein
VTFPTTDTDPHTAAVIAAIEPLRQRLHDRARTHGRHSEEYTRLVLLAADITTAVFHLSEAIDAATDGLIATPSGDVNPEQRYHTYV